MFGPTPLRDIFVIAKYELIEMRRTNRLWGFFAIFAGCSIAISMTIKKIFESFEGRFSGITSASNARIGSTIEKMLHTKEAENILYSAFHNRSAVDLVMDYPIVMVVFLYTSLVLMPMLAFVTSAENIVKDTESKAFRYISFRTGRAEYILGKNLAALILTSFLTILSGLYYIAFGLYYFVLPNDIYQYPLALISFMPTILIYSIPWIALFTTISTIATSTARARTFSLFALFIMNLLSSKDIFSVNSILWYLFKTLYYLTPYDHKDYLFDNNITTVSIHSGLLFFLSILYIGIGVATFRKRSV